MKKGIRVVLTVTSANPELFSDLEKVPARLRAERVRTLATLGLAAMSGGLAVPKPQAERQDAEQQQKKPDRAMNFAQSLIRNV